MFFPIYLANLDCGPLRSFRNDLQSKVADQLGKNMGNQAKLKRTLIISVYLLIFY